MARLSLRLLILPIAALAAAEPQTAHSTIRFEVAAIKPAAPGLGGESSLRKYPGRIDWRNVPLFELIKTAYGLADYQIKGPGWIHDIRYDIFAKIEPPDTARADVLTERIRGMLQTLLAERFALRFHYESQLVPGYRLTIAEGGPKIREVPARSPKLPEKAAEPSTTARRRLTGMKLDRDGYPILPEDVNEDSASGQSFATGKTHAVCNSIERLVGLVKAETGQPVLDATNLKGTYKIDLKYVTQKRMEIAPEMLERHPQLAGWVGGERDGETLMAAFKHQLGLELKAEKVPFQVLVVDHADRVPTAN